MQPTHPSHLPLKQWLTAHHISPAERRQFAAGARLSVNNLSQYVNGHRAITPRVAARLEQASLLLARVRAGAVPPLARGELAPTCRTCPYFLAAAGAAGGQGCVW